MEVHFIMAKLKREQRIEIYIKNCISFLNYRVRLIDKHGIDILRINKQSLVGTTIEYVLSSDGILFNWIRSYKENGCVIVKKAYEKIYYE